MKRTAKLTCLTASTLVFAIPTTARASNVAREVSGWYNDGWNAESHATYMANDHLFSEVNPYWYDLSGTTGAISERAYAYTPSNVIEAHANGDLVVPSIADQSSGQINTIIGKATSRQRLIDNIVATVNARGYDGFDLNFEHGKPAGKAAFSSFASALASALHASGKRLEITVQPASTAAEEAAYIFDYAALAVSGADRIKVMAYDHNFDAGTNVPGPIAPVSWIRSVLSYLTTTRGVPSSKLHLGLHNYGWTWKQKGSAWTLMSPFDTFTNVSQVSGGSAWQWDGQRSSRGSNTRRRARLLAREADLCVVVVRFVLRAGEDGRRQRPRRMDREPGRSSALAQCRSRREPQPHGRADLLGRL